MPASPQVAWVHDDRHGDLRIARATLALASGEQVVGWGRSSDARHAVACAVSELAERHALRHPRPLRFAAASELAACVAPRRLVRYAAAQCSARTALVVPRAGGRRAWLAGHELTSGADVWLPAECVHGPASLGLPAQQPTVMRPTSSGCAADVDLRTAIDRALHELFERDALARHWMAQRPGTAIALDTLPADVLHRCQALQALGCQVHVAVLQQQFGPVLLVLVCGHRRGFSCVGSACGRDPGEALRRAFTEAEFAARIHADRRSAVRTVTVRQVAVPADHAWLYSRRVHYRRALVLVGSGAGESWRALAARWPLHWSARLPAEHAAYWCELTTPQTPNQIDGRPLRVVRALVPGCVPLAFGRDALPRGMVDFVVPRAGRFPHPLA